MVPQTKLRSRFERRLSHWALGLTCGVVALTSAACKDAASLGSTGNLADPSGAPSNPATPTPTPTTPAPEDVLALYSGPESVAPYVAKFISDAQTQGVDVIPEMDGPQLEIQIASLDSYGSSVIGLCETGGIRRVTFDPDFWNSVSEAQREVLSHHELGHCVLLRPHRSTLLTSGEYASIMYPTILGASAYTNNRDYYINELFTFAASASSLAARAANALDPTQSQIQICDESEVLGGAQP